MLDFFFVGVAHCFFFCTIHLSTTHCTLSKLCSSRLSTQAILNGVVVFFVLLCVEPDDILFQL